MGENSQFCAGCGQPLWQKCDNCGTMALLTQPFCNGCGLNLAEGLKKRLSDFENLLTRVEAIGQEGRFDDAIRLAESVAEPADYRFQDIADRAQQAIEKLTQSREHWTAEVEKVRKRVKRYLPADRFDDIVRILSRIPLGALPDELAGVLEECRAKTSTISSSKTELKQALADKRYDDALFCLSQIVELNPDDKKYRKQLEQVAQKVLRKAARYGEKGKYAKAVALLESIPSQYQDDTYLDLMHRYEEVIFLRLVLAKATYMNPLVTGVLDKLERLTKNDPLIGKLRKRASEARRKVNSLKSEVWPEWMKPEKGQLGIPITPTRIPAAFPGARPDCIATKGSQFWVAMGLAIQATEQLMPNGDFLWSSKPKGVRGLLGGKRPKRSQFGWGIDIGDSSVKAVRIKLAGEPSRPHIDRATIIKLDKPKAGKSHKVNKEAIDAALQKLVSDADLGDDPAVINYPGSELVSRYLLLPPSTDRKKLDEFILQDARANIPISMDLLQTAYHLSDLGDDELVSPSAILVAGRKTDIEFRKSLVENSGLVVSGILPEPFALWNALQSFGSDAEALTLNVSDEVEQEATQQRQSLADMVVEVGQNRTNVVISHPKGLWYRTIDWGLADLNAALCTAMKLTTGDADKMRREPLRAKHLQIPVDAMMAACQVPRREVERSAYAARDAIGELRLRRVMLIGGGAYQPFLSSWFNGCSF